MQKFAEKVVLIAGGTSGIGQTTAIAFAKLGAKVIVAVALVALVEQASSPALYLKQARMPIPQDD